MAAAFAGGYLALSILIFPDGVCSFNSTINSRVHRHLVDLLHSDHYDKTLKPHTGDCPLIASLDVILLDVTGVSQSEGYFSADLAVTQVWQDPQLSFDDLLDNTNVQNVSLQPDMAKLIWTPNICFVNSKQARMHFSPDANVLVQVMPNGTVWLQYRVHAQGPCNIDLSKFPMDVQGCTLVFESYSYIAADVRLQWAHWENPLTKSAAKYKIPDFTLAEVSLAKEQLEYTAGIWDQLMIKLTFKRKMGYYMLQAYVPTYVCVVVSWVSFYLDSGALAARASLGVNTLMALIINFGNIIADLPRVSYMRAIDIWMFGCMFQTFGTLLEYALVGFVERTRQRNARKKRDKKRLEESENNSANEESKKGKYNKMPQVCINGKVRYIFKKTEKKLARMPSSLAIDTDAMSGWRGCDIDNIAAKWFPAAFVAFNICYWVYFLW